MNDNRKASNAYCIELFYAKSDQRETLKHSLLTLAEKSKQEPGCIKYEVLENQTNSDCFILILQYTDQAAMKAHENQTYIKEFSEHHMNNLCEKVTWYDATLVND